MEKKDYPICPNCRQPLDYVNTVDDLVGNLWEVYWCSKCNQELRFLTATDRD